MSIYLVNGKGWRYDFTLRGTRYTKVWFRTKREARRAEAKRKEELKNPKPEVTPTDMDFLELVEKRLDHVKAYNSASHYRDTLSYARGWITNWGSLKCSEITTDMVQEDMLKRSHVSHFTANRDHQILKTLFAYGMKKRWISTDPTESISLFPVEKRCRYVPPKEDVLKVILAAEPRVQDYLWVLIETLGRMGEVNRLTWSDVDFENHCVTLYTRKKRGGHLTPREVHMNDRLYDVLSRLYERRDKTKDWVFWHRYWDARSNKWVEGPYQGRSKIMKTLCEKAGVKYFRFHPLRHFGASVLDRENVHIGVIQKALGHENRKTTERYLHSIGGAEREAMRILGEALKDSHTNPHTETNKGQPTISQVIDFTGRGERI